MDVYLNHPVVLKAGMFLGAILLAVLSATVMKGSELAPLFSHGATAMLGAALLQILGKDVQVATARGVVDKADMKIAVAVAELERASNVEVNQKVNVNEK